MKWIMVYEWTYCNETRKAGSSAQFQSIGVNSLGSESESSSKKSFRLGFEGDARCGGILGSWRRGTVGVRIGNDIPGTSAIWNFSSFFVHSGMFTKLIVWYRGRCGRGLARLARNSLIGMISGLSHTYNSGFSRALTRLMMTGTTM